MRITGEEAEVINIAIGALLASGGGALSAWWTNRRAKGEARVDRRRDAYAALILAFDRLERTWIAGETLESDDLKLNIGQNTAGVVREINSTYVSVLLAGSNEAKKQAKTARNLAWELNNLLHGRNDQGEHIDAKKIFTTQGEFSDAARDFVKVAERELGLACVARNYVALGVMSTFGHRSASLEEIRNQTGKWEHHVDQEWKISHIKREVVDAHDGLIVLEWKLNRAPEPEWVKYFITGHGHKSGTADFVSRAPQAEGSKIRFTVREEDLENAVGYVESSISGANQMFDTYVMSRRREEEARRQAAASEKDRRLREARQRLERMDP